MQHNRDILWKGLLEWVFDDLLRFVFPDAEQVFDLERGFSFLDKELAEMYPEPEKKSDTKVVDKLVKVYHRDGTEEWVLIHLEVQGKTKSRQRQFFPERMFRYFYRIFDRYRKPVAAVAIYSGPDGKDMPDTYVYEFLNTRLEYRFNTLCILDYPEEKLKKSDNPFAWVILTARTALLTGRNLDEKLLVGKLFIFRRLYESGVFGRRKLQAILVFLNNYIRFKNSETNRIFNLEVEKITEKKNTMDIFEQVAEMKVEEKSWLVVSNLLTDTAFSVEKIASLADVSIDFVKEVKKSIKKK
jgi:hypothetical protein